MTPAEIEQGRRLVKEAASASSYTRPRALTFNLVPASADAAKDGIGTLGISSGDLTMIAALSGGEA